MMYVLEVSIYSGVNKEASLRTSHTIQANELVALTIFIKSSVYTRLLYPCVGPSPPNSTAWWSSTIVREKLEQGGGLVPVTVGEDHIPERAVINRAETTSFARFG